MKNYIKTITLLLLSSIFISSSCKKNTPTNTEEQLPPETHIGANTFGCKVDGKVYIASGSGGLLASQKVRYNYVGSDSSINIFASNSESKFNFRISINYLGAIGIYLTKAYPYTGTFYDDSNGTLPNNSNIYETNISNIGRVNIKYFYGSSSPMNGVSGTFEMEAVNANGKVINITEGRFDIGF
jgi:hypothetical protein